jgi:hypothetical protein
MSTFSFTVDTQEMAHSIDEVSSHVGVVTAAVVAMQTAVVAADTAGANRICQHVEQGFFSLIRSQITQKIATMRSEVDSRFLEMRQQGQALAGIKTRMERDFQMIAARYTRVFHSIDLSLRNRVFELDKAVLTLVSRHLERIQIRWRSLQAQVPVHQCESVQTAQMVATSQAKVNAQRAIGTMKSFLSGSQKQAALLESMLFRTPPGASGLRSVPVLLMETDGISVPATQWDVRGPIAPRVPSAKNINDGAQSVVFSSLSSLKWRSPDKELGNRVGAEFRKLLGQGGMNDRVKDHMIRLSEASPWQALAGSPT